KERMMFKTMLLNRTTAVWGLLIAVTIASWEFGHGVGFDDVRHASLAIIVSAFIKTRFVLLDFMELRHAPLFMRIGVEVWGVVICAALCGLYWFQPVFGA
ncbi:MAG TPA: cytochrome C oxidase subunit IV family protein, partial [Macromonas sp.]|nr:cytochrome C oxidase subunit IV family protein [Macromonas sp.]